MKLLGYAVLALLISCAGTSAEAATYTIDYNEGSYIPSASGIFDSSVFGTDTFSSIDSLSIDFYIAGRREYTNSQGNTWYYDNSTNISAGGEQLANSYSLGSDFVTLHFDLGATAINQLITTQSLLFSLTSNDVYYTLPSGSDRWGNRSRFYLDYVTLNIVEGAPSNVPLPAAVVLFGSGLAGLAGVARRKKA